jgi:hypothetical protein
VTRHSRCLLVAAVLLAGAPAIVGQQASSTRRHVETLASAALEGRLTGSAGERLAADYLVGELKFLGVRPLPGAADLRVGFDFTAGTRDGGSVLTVSTPAMSTKFDRASDVQALSFSDNVEITGPVAFAGYGIVVPAGQQVQYDSYAGLDIKDKIVLVLRYFPEDATQGQRAVLARYADLRYKALAARQRGARAMLVVTGPRSPNAGLTIPMSFDTALSGSGIAAASVSIAPASMMLATGGRTLEAAQRALDSADPHQAGFPLPGLTVTLRSAVQRERQKGFNVIGYLPAAGSTAGVAKPWIAVGAHYDHLGHGRNGNSLARSEEAGQFHLGADDNASGTAAVLSVAAALATEARHRNLLVALWSGEELGLIGSAAYTANPVGMDLDQLAAYINFDMVGRMQDNKLTIQGLGTSPSWPRTIEQVNVLAAFDLQLHDDPYQPTDVATFAAAGVPAITFFTGVHADYHRPTDTADKIDYEDLDRVADFAAALLRRLDAADAPPLFTRVEQQAAPAGRGGVRVFTGTIPDYSTEAKGLLLSGVIGGGPAERAGLAKGDVIVEIGGQSITNIYDYTYALDALKIGEPTRVIYLRDGKRRETTLLPQARN